MPTTPTVQPVLEAWDVLKLRINEVSFVEAQRLLGDYLRYVEDFKQSRAARVEAEGSGRDTMSHVPAQPHRPAPDLAFDGFARLTDAVGDMSATVEAAIELHSDETNGQLIRIADAMERIAAKLEGTAALRGETLPAA